MIGEYHARLDRGVLRIFVAVLLAGGFGGGWYWASLHEPQANRWFGVALPVVVALLGLILVVRRELHVGPYGIVMTTWPVPIGEVRLTRHDVLVVAVAKRRGRRVRWDVVAQTRSQGYRRLTLPHPDNVTAEQAAAAIRAALDIIPS